MNAQDVDLVSMTLVYKHASGIDIPAIVHYAKGEDNSKKTARPIALAFHVGGFILGSAAMIPKTQIRALAKMGFVVVTPEYRLCPQVALYDGPIQDAKDCLLWAQNDLPASMLEKEGVRVDGDRVVAVGYSCGGHMALHLGAVPNPPKAILSFYPSIYFSDPFYKAPFKPFANVPTPSPEFLQQIHDGPQALTSPPMFTPAGAPNLATPRTAWMVDALKNGTHLRDCVADGDYDRCDPTTYFKSHSAQWPPTCFVHGTADISAPEEWSQRAKKELVDLGVAADVLSVKGVGHVFDLPLKEGDELFEDVVMKSLRFLEKHV